jgi:hypothetical protein
MTWSATKDPHVHGFPADQRPVPEDTITDLSATEAEEFHGISIKYYI